MEIERDDPIPVRKVCDAPEEIKAALGSLPEYGEAVVIERDGVALGALIPMKDLALYQRLFFDREMEIDIAAADAALAEGGVPNPLARMHDVISITADSVIFSKLYCM